MSSITGIVTDTLARFADGIVAALPKLIAGVVFLVVAAIGIRVAVWAAASVVSRTTDQPIYVQFVRTLVGVFLWFGALLAFLTLVGLPGIAAALGTASGFLALGVSYALSGMLADAVAGIYLLRDPDFNPGDRVVAGDTDGVVSEIELRKTRFEVGDDIVVRANAEVEKKWTKKRDSA
ncbi:mechanosensitive ion channel domain-containing protein [Halarchaeum salinum]|uniref:Mechanosensitive ion channel MscS domain-containing protein n=1 Tax=Halarchaeum salinum TaxID=489912 RepID=A0AAV3S6M4_9EURY